MAAKHKKKVSIIIPAFNAENTIRRAILSVMEQTYLDWQLIVVDDGSSDSTVQVVSEFLQYSNIQLIVNKENSGVSSARNLGLDVSESEFVAFLDSDDYWSNNKLEKQLEVATSHPSAIIHSYYYRKSANGKCLGLIEAPNICGYNELLSRNVIGLSTALVSREVIGDTRFENIGHEDFAFWLDLLRKPDTYTYCVKRPLATYLVHDSSLSSNKLKAAFWMMKILFIREKLSFIRATSCFINYALSGFFGRK